MMFWLTGEYLDSSHIENNDMLAAAAKFTHHDTTWDPSFKESYSKMIR
jgi:hypothetical protein